MCHGHLGRTLRRLKDRRNPSAEDDCFGTIQSPCRSSYGLDRNEDDARVLWACTRNASEVIPSTALLPLQADPADTDADDLPDAWEAAHDLDPAIVIGVHGPYGDPDMDGIAKLREYQPVAIPGLPRRR